MFILLTSRAQLLSLILTSKWAKRMYFFNDVYYKTLKILYNEVIHPSIFIATEFMSLIIPLERYMFANI